MSDRILFLSTGKSKGSGELQELRYAFSNQNAYELSDMCIEPRRKGSNEKKGIKEQVVQRVKSEKNVICDDLSLPGKGINYSKIPGRICVVSASEFWISTLLQAISSENIKKIDLSMYSHIVCTLPIMEKLLGKALGDPEDKRIIRCLPTIIGQKSDKIEVSSIYRRHKISEDTNICFVAACEQDEDKPYENRAKDVLELMNRMKEGISGKIVFIFRDIDLAEDIRRSQSTDLDMRIMHPGTDMAELVNASKALISDDPYLMQLFGMYEKKIEVISGSENGKMLISLLEKAADLQLEKLWGYNAEACKTSYEAIVDILQVL